MTYLKRVEMVGFKSFTDRTVVPFGTGISAVVGPNGCGKSNIIDAIRWVMGEQSPKLLRARNMEDLLFNGSRGKPASALAEVILTLARDTDRGMAEISITRRLYRTGDSEYLINRSPSRLKDVMRFFIEMGMGTRSYAIIEQERVGRLVDARPEERRLLLDEAAGITRYKEQKRESERKIESALRNLETVSLMMAENTKRLAQVTRQAAKATRHAAVRDELRRLELALAARGYLEHGERRAGLAAGRDEARELAASLIARASELELEAEALKLEDTRADLMVEDALSAFHALDAGHSKATQELEHLRKSRGDATERREAAAKELAGQEGERETFELDRARLESDASAFASESESLAAAATDAKGRLGEARRAHEQADIKARAAARAADGVRDSLARAGEGVAGAESLAEHLTGRRRSLELEQNEMGHTLAAAAEKSQSRARFKRGLEDDLATVEEEAGFLREDATAARKASEDARADAARSDSRAAGLKARLETLESLETSFSWHPHEVGELMARPELRDLGVIGPVAESVQIPRGAEEAAEAYLGARLSWVLVEDLRGALAALKAARENRLGVYGFVIRRELGDRPLAEALLGGKIELAELPGLPVCGPGTGDPDGPTSGGGASGPAAGASVQGGADRRGQGKKGKKGKGNKGQRNNGPAIPATAAPTAGSGAAAQAGAAGIATRAAGAVTDGTPDGEAADLTDPQGAADPQDAANPQGATDPQGAEDGTPGTDAAEAATGADGGADADVDPRDALERLAESLPEGTVALTRDGSFISRAVVAGGAKPVSAKGGKESKGVLARLREKEQAEADYMAAKGELELTNARAAERREALEAAEDALAQKLSARNALVSDVSKADARLVEAVSEEKGLKIRSDSLSAERARVEQEIEAAAAKREKFLKDRDELEARLADAVAEAEALGLAARSAAESLGELQEREAAAALDAASAAEKLEGARRELKRVMDFLGSMDSRRKSLEAEAERLAAQEESLGEKILKLESETEGMPERIEEAREKLKNLRGEKDAIRAQLSGKEDELRAARKSREEGQDGLNALEKDLMEAEYRLARIRDNMLKDWHAEFRIPGEDDGDEADEADASGGNGTEEATADPESDESDAGGEGGVVASVSGREGGNVVSASEGEGGNASPATEGEGGNASPVTEGGVATAEGESGATDGGKVPGESAGASAPRDPGSGKPVEDRIAEGASEGIEYPASPGDAPGEGAGPGSGPVAGSAPASDAPQDPEAAAPPTPPIPAKPEIKPPEILDPRDYAEQPIPPDAEERARKLRERLGQIGEVNLDAIEEERELKKKVGFYETQYLDLQKAIGDLKDGIERINAICRARFTETFQNVSQKFQEIFPVLFEGGEGWLRLVEDQDPLEAGVEIRVHPPGKKITVMSLLSGGEKALTALALIFALYLIRPSPFCLLDEADAPLDEANIDRFNRLLRRLAESSQIIMVTHNKRTMQISDTLYGVTMETPGVSRLVSVNMSQAEALTR
ncbi:MAG: AAA family ATPase [Deltaproteobacteria bacterium]|jgi:chromosome segregation protein|nr:AAA family ATPase [Deltaproteobacteria bacterium]